MGSTTPTIDERFENVALKDVLRLLKKKYNVKLAYSERLVADKTVTVDLDRLGIADAFEKILEGLPVTFEFIQPNAVILKPKPAGPSNINLNGEIFDLKTGERLPFALVTEQQSGKSTTTNEDGYFSLEIPFSSPKLSVSYIGYNDTLLVPQDVRNRRLMIGMQPSFNTLGEVLVSANSDNFSSSEGIGEVDLNPSLVRRMPQTAEKDVFRMLQMLPGLSATDELSSGLSINGGTANQNLILFDGFSIYHQDHLFGYFSAINPYAVKSVRTLKTGYPANYGGRSSGVVQFTGNDGSNTGFSGRLGMNLLSANISLETPLTPNSTAFFSARRSYTDFYPTFLFNRIFDLYVEQINDVDAVIESQQYDPEFQYDDLNFKVSTRLNPRDLLSVSFYRSNDRLNFDEHLVVRYPEDTLSMNANNGFIEWGNIGASARMTRLWNDTDFSELIVSFSDYRSRYLESSLQTTTVEGQVTEELSFEDNQRNGIEDLGLKLTHEARMGLVTWQLGSEFSLVNTEIQNLLNNELLIGKEQDGLLLATGYLQTFTQLRPTTILGIGSRATYSEGRQQVYFEPRLSITEELSSTLKLRASAGMYNQFVNQINSLSVLQGSRDLWVLADEEVPAQLATHYALGAAYAASSGFGVDFNVYHRRFRGILEYAFRRGNEITEFLNYEELFFEGEGRGTGLELMFKKESPLFNGWLSYTLSKTENRFEPLSGGNWYDADQDQRHELNVYLSRKWNRFTFYSTWVYGSGRPYSSFSGGREARENRRDDIIIVSATERNNQRLPAYHRMDFGVSSTWRWTGLELTANFHLFNLYNRENIQSIQIRPLPGPRGRGGGSQDDGDGDGPPPPPPPGDGGPPPPPDGGGPDQDGNPPSGRGKRPAFATTENKLMRLTPSFSIEIKF